MSCRASGRARLTGRDRLLGARFLILVGAEKAAEREYGDLRRLSVDLDDEGPRPDELRLAEETAGALLEDVELRRASFVYGDAERQAAQSRVAYAAASGVGLLAARRGSARSSLSEPESASPRLRPRPCRTPEGSRRGGSAWVRTPTRRRAARPVQRRYGWPACDRERRGSRTRATNRFLLRLVLRAEQIRHGFADTVVATSTHFRACAPSSERGPLARFYADLDELIGPLRPLRCNDHSRTGPWCSPSSVTVVPEFTAKGNRSNGPVDVRSLRRRIVPRRPRHAMAMPSKAAKPRELRNHNSTGWSRM